MSEKPMGVVYGMPAAEYHAIDAMSATGLRELARSPWHYKNRVQIVPTKPMLTGTLAHCAVLEPNAMDERYIVAPTDAPRRPSKSQWQAKNPSPDSAASMAWWSDFNARAANREIVTSEEFDVTKAQLAAVMSNHTLEELFSAGAGEVSVFWIDSITGIYCKARPDWVHQWVDGSVSLVDLKSTVDESPAGFSRTLARMGYHRQGAHYSAGYTAASGRPVREFVFAAVTSAPPVLAVAYVLDDEAQQQGADEVAELLDVYADCLRDNYWPAFIGRQPLSLPAWAKRTSEVEVSYA